MSHNKAFNPPSQIKFVKNILVGNVQGLFQIQESPLPLNPAMLGTLVKTTPKISSPIRHNMDGKCRKDINPIYLYIKCGL